MYQIIAKKTQKYKITGLVLKNNYINKIITKFYENYIILKLLDIKLSVMKKLKKSIQICCKSIQKRI